MQNKFNSEIQSLKAQIDACDAKMRDLLKRQEELQVNPEDGLRSTTKKWQDLDEQRFNEIKYRSSLIQRIDALRSI